MQYLDRTKNNISSFIESQLPWFMRTQFDFTDDGTKTKILKFMEYYYQWLEKEYDLTLDEYGEYGISSFKNTRINQVVNEKFNLFNALNRIRDFTDIDTVPYKYLKNLRQQLMPDVPIEIEGDVRRTMKLIKDFNTRKGTAKSFDFMFRALFNKSVDIVHNEEKIMSPSSANWVKPILLRAKLISTTNVTESDLNSLIGYHLRGEISGAYARVTEVNNYHIQGTRVSEFLLDKNDITGRFIDDEYLEGIYIQPQPEISVTGVKVGNIYRIHTVGDTDFIKMGATESTVGYAFKANKVGIGTGLVISEDDLDYADETIESIYRPDDATEKIRVQSVTGVKEIAFRVSGSGHTMDDLLVVSNNGSPTNVSLMTGGTNYSAGTFSTINTVGGEGTGLTITITVSGGAAITGTVAASGTGYTDNEIVILDDDIKLFNAQTAVDLTANTITIPSHGFSDNQIVRYLIGFGDNSVSKSFNASGSVNIENDRITILDHGFYTTDSVIYTKGAGSAPAGLNTGYTYYVIRIDAHTLQLATTYINAAAGTPINISGVGPDESNTLARSDAFSDGDSVIGGLINSSLHYVDLVDTNTIRLAASSNGSARDLTSHGGANVNHSLTGDGDGSGASFKITGIDSTGGASARITGLTKGKVDDILINDGGSGYAVGDEFELIGTYLEIAERTNTNFSAGEYIMGETSKTTARIRAVVGNKLYLDEIRGTGFVTDYTSEEKYAGETIIRIKDSAGVSTAVASGSFVTGTSYHITRGGSHEYYSYQTDFVAIGADNTSVGTIFTATGAGSASDTGAAFPRDINARCRLLISGDSNVGSGKVVSLISEVLLSSDPGTIVTGTVVAQTTPAGAAWGTVMSQSANGTTLYVSRTRPTKLPYVMGTSTTLIDFVVTAGTWTFYTYASPGGGTTGHTVTGVVSGVIEEVELYYGGSGFEEAPYTWIETTSGTGADFMPYGSEIGGVERAIVVSPGINYGSNSTVSSQEKTEPWTTAKGSVRTETIIEFDGRYLDSRGFLSSDSVIQDGREHEPWSYSIGSDLQFEKWVEPISTIAHPVGTKIFPTYIVNEKLTESTSGYIKVDQATS